SALAALMPQLVALAEGGRLLSLQLQTEGGSLRLSVTPAGVPTTAPAGTPASVQSLSSPLPRMYRRLVEDATPEPVPCRKSIALAGYCVHSDSRGAVTALCRMGLLQRTPDGIIRGTLPLPGNSKAGD